MKATKWIVLATTILAVAALPVLTDDTSASGNTGSSTATEETSGVDNAIARVETATTHHIDILTALLAKAPAQAQAGIQQAIAAAQKGHDTALAALMTKDADEPGEPSSGTGSSTATGGSTTTTTSAPDVRGLERAKQAVTSAFQKSVSILQGLVSKVPTEASTSIQQALTQVQENRTIALQNLDRLIAGHKSERQTAADRTHQNDRTTRAERPERPHPTGRP